MGVEETFASLDELRQAKAKHALAAQVVRFFAPRQGLVVETHSEAPNGAGISGSSSMFISTVSAFNKLLGCKHKPLEIREIAQNLEAQVIAVPTGCQDYFPALFGGVNAIELRVDGLHRYEVKTSHDELNRRFVLAYTGKPRNSGINNWEVTKAHIDGRKKVHDNFAQIAAIAHAMRGALERGAWQEAARLLRDEWAHRRKNAPGITTPLIDRLVRATRRNGACAAKVCGAGGGGCVVFLVEPDAKERVAEIIRREGATVLDARVEPRGVRVTASA
jgi:D-glycero-alpha-D-manno-heptose-7-phosphate kinase